MPRIKGQATRGRGGAGICLFRTDYQSTLLSPSGKSAGGGVWGPCQLGRHRSRSRALGPAALGPPGSPSQLCIHWGRHAVLALLAKSTPSAVARLTHALPVSIPCIAVPRVPGAHTRPQGHTVSPLVPLLCFLSSRHLGACSSRYKALVSPCPREGRREESWGGRGQQGIWMGRLAAPRSLRPPPCLAEVAVCGGRHGDAEAAQV